MNLIQTLQNRFAKPRGLIIPGNGGVHRTLTFKVALGICTHRDVKLQVFNLLRGLESCPDPKINVAMCVGDALIDRSRSKIASEFLMKRDEDILWFIDDDIVTNNQDMTRMMWEMWKYDLDILCAPYALKSMKEKAFAVRLLENKDEVVCGKGGEIKEIMYASTGCMGIRRRVFEKMVEKELVHLCHPETQRFYPFFCPMEKNLNGKWIYLSEDWAACERARSLGFKVWADFGTKLGHIGAYTYTFDDFLAPPVEKKEGFVYRVDIQRE